MFFATIALLIATLVGRAWLEQALTIRWRTHLTRGMLARWLDGQTFYRIELDNTCDNPDQRLTEDVTEYVRLMIALTLGFIGNLGTLGSMGWILWQSAGPVSFQVGGGSLTIPGYLFWVAIGWGLLQTVATHAAGHKLAGATVVQQATEADFRFALAKVRDARRTGGAVPRQCGRAAAPDAPIRCHPRQLGGADEAQHLPQHRQRWFRRGGGGGAHRGHGTQGAGRRTEPGAR